MNGNFAWDFPGGWYGLGSVFLILLAVSALSAWTTRRPVGTGIRLLMTLTRAGAFALLRYLMSTLFVRSLGVSKAQNASLMTQLIRSVCMP